MSQIDYFELGRQTSAESRIAQGLPPKVTSPAALARVAALLAPENLDAGRVKPGRATVRGRKDHDPVDHGPGELVSPRETTGGDGVSDRLADVKPAERATAAAPSDLTVDSRDPVVNGRRGLDELAA